MATTQQDKKNYKNIIKVEVINLFGIIIMVTQFDFGSCLELWKTNFNSKFNTPPKFGTKVVTS